MIELVVAAVVVVVVVATVVAYLLADHPPPVNLNGAHLIITGGSSGVGLSLGIKAAQGGANVTIIARGKDKLEVAKKKIETVRKDKSQKIIALSVDVSNVDSINNAIQEAAAANKDVIDVLICSAGVTHVERFLEADVKKAATVSDINYLGSVAATKAAVPYMIKQKRGRIIYVSSILGLMGFPGYSLYSPTKFALKGLAESLQSELHHHSIYFSISCPANIDTPMYEEEEKTKPPETKALEDGKKPASADSVADGILRSLTSWRFLIPSDQDSAFVSYLSAGFAPASFQEILLQLFLGPILRIVSLTEIKKYRQTVQKHLKK